jgi:DNA-binding IclR family transcriptional regulator
LDYTVAAVDEAIGLLFLVAQNPGLGVTELAKRSGNTKPRAFRLLTTLEQRGLVRRQEPQTTYSLGFQALQLGAAANQQLDLTRLAQPVLLEIGEQCNESVQVRVRDGLETLVVASRESTQTVRVHSDMRRPLHAGASGKVMLAYAPEEIRQALLASELTRYTTNTIVQRTKLAKELARVQEQGYAVSFGEISSDAAAIAAPIRGANGQVVAVLGISGPASRIRPDNAQAIISLVVAGARKLSAALGYIEGAPAPTPPATQRKARKSGAAPGKSPAARRQA